eukprot:SAG11_NODE_15744_length_567_cov_1.660256_2_plen_86_part_01
MPPPSVAVDAAAASPTGGGSGSPTAPTPRPVGAEEWERRVAEEPGWHTTESAQDAYTGESVIEHMAKYQTARDNESTRAIAQKHNV